MTIIQENVFKTLDLGAGDSIEQIDIFSGSRGEKKIFLQRNCLLNYFFIANDSTITITINSDEPSSTVNAHGIILSRHTPTKVVFVHSLGANHVKSTIYLLSLLTDNSRCEVDGKILLKPGIQKASGNLLEENLILGEKIRLKILPMLDARSNDVQAFHGATIQKINPHQLFYLTSKGLDRKKAEQLVIDGAIEKCLSHFKYLQAQEKASIKEFILLS